MEREGGRGGEGGSEDGEHYTTAGLTQTAMEYAPPHPKLPRTVSVCNLQQKEDVSILHPLHQHPLTSLPQLSSLIAVCNGHQFNEFLSG